MLFQVAKAPCSIEFRPSFCLTTAPVLAALLLGAQPFHLRAVFRKASVAGAAIPLAAEGAAIFAPLPVAFERIVAAQTTIPRILRVNL